VLVGRLIWVRLSRQFGRTDVGRRTRAHGRSRRQAGVGAVVGDSTPGATHQAAHRPADDRARPNLSSCGPTDCQRSVVGCGVPPCAQSPTEAIPTQAPSTAASRKHRLVAATRVESLGVGYESECGTQRWVAREATQCRSCRPRCALAERWPPDQVGNSVFAQSLRAQWFVFQWRSRPLPEVPSSKSER